MVGVCRYFCFGKMGVYKVHFLQFCCKEPIQASYLLTASHITDAICIKALFEKLDTYCSSDAASSQETTCLYRLCTTKDTNNIVKKCTLYTPTFPKQNYRHTPTYVATPPLRPGAVRTDSQTSTSLQPQRRLEDNEISPERTAKYRALSVLAPFRAKRADSLPGV